MDFSRRDFLKVSGAAGVAVAAVSLAGCGSGEGSSASSNGTSSKEAKYKIKLAYQPTSGQVFQFIAEKHGFNQEEGVEVEVTPLGSVPDAVSALSAGKIDVASTYGTGGPLGQIANGQPFTIFGGYMIIGETPIYGKPESVLNTPEDLKGKRLGITRGGTADISMKGILYDRGIGFVYDGSTFPYLKNRIMKTIIRIIGIAIMTPSASMLRILSAFASFANCSSSARIEGSFSCVKFEA